MQRISRGWRLAKDSWAVLKADRSLALFPILSFTFGAIAFLLLIAPGAAITAASDSDYAIAPFALLAAYGATFASVYFNVALAAAAAQSLDGKDTTLQDGLSVARSRRGLIAKWAFIQFAVGVLINLIESALRDTPVGGIVASIIGGLLGAAWAIASFFVIPVLALEEVGPKDALKRSGSLIKERWGEGFVGSASISLAIFLITILPVGIMAAIAVATIDTAPAAAVAAIAVGVAIVIAAAVIGSALGVIFRVALYRFATAGQATAGFADADLAAAFTPRKRGRA